MEVYHGNGPDVSCLFYAFHIPVKVDSDGILIFLRRLYVVLVAVEEGAVYRREQYFCLVGYIVFR